MTNSSAQNGFLSGRLGLSITAATVAIGLTAFAIWPLLGCGLFTSRGEVPVRGAELRSPDKLTLIVASCNKNPEISLLRETDVDVQVRVVADTELFPQSGDDCQDIVEVQLQEPLGDRALIDKHTGQRVSVTLFGPTAQMEQLQESGTEKKLADDEPKAVDTGNKRGARHEIAVEVAWLQDPETLVINANTCHRNPELSLLRETDVDVTVEMVVDPDPYPNGGPECLEELIVKLEGPLGDRTVTDAHTGKALSVTPVAGAPPRQVVSRKMLNQLPTEVVPQAIRDAVSEAELQDLQAVAEQYGITLQEAFDRYAWNDNFSRMVSESARWPPTRSRERRSWTEVTPGSVSQALLRAQRST